MVGLPEIRLESERVTVCRLGSGVIMKYILPDDAHVNMGSGIRWMQAQCLAVLHQRLLGLSDLVESQPQMVVDGGIVFPESNGFAIFSGRRLPLVLPSQGIGEVAVSMGIVWRHTDCLDAKKRVGLHAEASSNLVGWVVLHPRRSSVIPLMCLVWLTQLPVGHGEKQPVRDAVSWPQLLGLVEGRNTLQPGAIPIVRHTQRVPDVGVGGYQVLRHSGLLDSFGALGWCRFRVLGQVPC